MSTSSGSQVSPEKRDRCARMAKRPLCTRRRGCLKGQVCEGGKEATMHREEMMPLRGGLREARSSGKSSTLCVGKRYHQKQGDGGPKSPEENP